MSYVIGKFYQSIKFIVATAGTGGSIAAIVWGSAFSGGVIPIVGGSLCLANSLFNYIEIGKVNFDIKKQLSDLTLRLTQFSQENTRLSDNVDSLAQLRDQFIKENNTLQATLQKSAIHLDQLEKIKNEYDQVNTKLSTELHQENSSLGDNVAKIITLYNQFAENLGQANTQLAKIEEIKASYEAQIGELKNSNAVMAKEIHEQNQLIIQSKRVIKTLAQFGDEYKSIATGLDTDLSKLDQTDANLEHTSLVLHNLVDELQNKTFDEIDTNHDGMISREEFLAAMKK